MSLNRRKKSIKFRGDHTHGYGSKKKHRGSGHQGGVGMAGTGKKADQKRPSIWKDPKYFGRHGFTSVAQKRPATSVNIFYLENNFDTLVTKGLIKKDGDSYSVNLADLGFDKLLGSGTPSKKFKITCDFASKKAISKVEEKGSITVKFKSE